MFFATSLLAVSCLVPVSTLRAQAADRKQCSVSEMITDVADPGSVLLRAEQLRGTAGLSALTIRRPSTDRMALDCDAARLVQAGRLSIDALPLRLVSAYNSAYPVDVNNGALWSGRGLAAGAMAGVEARFGPFTAALYPTVAYQANKTFRTSPQNDTKYTPFAYTGHVIDWPQRFGDAGFWTIDPGQSYVRVDVKGLAAGVSTENLWFGPAQRTPLMMGSSAPGFPHAFIATARPLDVGIGNIEVQFIAGRLSESDYFDFDPSNDHRVLTGASAVIEPAFARGLFIGLNRLYTAYEDGAESYLLQPYLNLRENTMGSNQLISVYARWAHPSAGFEAYAEWGREDGWGEWVDLLREPDHGQVYLLGFQKTGTWRGDLRWFGELAHLEAANTLRGGRGIVTLYTHHEIIQGHTNRGQLLGAWIGPGSDTQLLGVEHTTERRSSSLSIERVRYDDDAYYTLWGRFYAQNGHDVSLGALLGHTERFGDLSIRGALGAAHRFNRNFVYLDGAQPGNYQAENNVRLELDASWYPRR